MARPKEKESSYIKHDDDDSLDKKKRDAKSKVKNREAQTKDGHPLKSASARSKSTQSPSGYKSSNMEPKIDPKFDNTLELPKCKSRKGKQSKVKDKEKEKQNVKQNGNKGNLFPKKETTDDSLQSESATPLSSMSKSATSPNDINDRPQSSGQQKQISKKQAETEKMRPLIKIEEPIDKKCMMEKPIKPKRSNSAKTKYKSTDGKQSKVKDTEKEKQNVKQKGNKGNLFQKKETSDDSFQLESATPLSSMAKSATSPNDINDRPQSSGQQKQISKKQAETEIRLPPLKKNEAAGKSEISETPKQVNSLRSYSEYSYSLKTDRLTVIIMNTHCSKKNQGSKPAQRRKQTIPDVIEKFSPDIVLFQEFTWKYFPFPERYYFRKHEQAALLIDESQFEIEDFLKDVDTLTSRTRNEMTKYKLRIDPNEFTPRSRMAIRRIEKKGKSSGQKIIVISWHGRSNKQGGGRLSTNFKVALFRYLFEFLRKIKEEFKLPIIIGGDFNIKRDKIKGYVTEPFKLIPYKPSRRRRMNVIDYYIATDDLVVSDARYIDLEEDSTAENPNQVFDHDPIIAYVH